MRDELLFGRSVNWDDIPEEVIRPGVRRRCYATDSVMLVWHSLDVGMALNPHRHEDFDQLATVLDGRALYYIDGVPHEMTAGSMLLVPRGHEHYIEPVQAPCINLDVFAPPRADLADACAWIAAR
jgi:quercetin dioxygenase-like cupin family protein